MMKRATLTVELTLPVTVVYNYLPGRPASGPRGEPPINPPEPAEVEVESVTIAGLDISPSINTLDMETIEAQIIEHEEEDS